MMNRRRHVSAIARRGRSGMTLIEVVVACTLLAVTLSGLTGVAIKMTERTRTSAILEQRTAVFAQEVNRLSSVPYDSLVSGSYLRTDSLKAGSGYYVWSYVVGDPVISTTSGVPPYRDITLTVTPRLAPTRTQTATIRRSRAPYSSPLNTGA